MSLLPVEAALDRILAAVPGPVPVESVPLDEAFGRTLAADLAALRDQPPFDASAMDGYAVRAADLTAAPARLRVIGESAAGHAFGGRLGPGEAVRIFTGAPVPAGADTILMQENATREGDVVTARQSEPKGRFVREAGYDFRKGDALLGSGTCLGPQALALAAAMDHAAVTVRQRPLIGLLATGDELVAPGAPRGVDQIVTSNSYAVAAIAAAAGGAACDLGIARDDARSIRERLAAARAAGCHVLVTLGGASVGDHDLVQTVLQGEGLALDFWKIAMRPGKPLMFGRLGEMLFLGLPGNPVSAIVCAHLFLAPLIRRLLGQRETARWPEEYARLGRDLPANDERQDYLRATLTMTDDGPVATPFPRQDSGMVAVLAAAQALVIRPPQASAAAAGERCRIIRL